MRRNDEKSAPLILSLSKDEWKSSLPVIQQARHDRIFALGWIYSYVRSLD